MGTKAARRSATCADGRHAQCRTPDCGCRCHVLNAGELYDSWVAQHHDEWRERGMGPASLDYAWIVCQARAGDRNSVAWGWSLTGGGKRDAQNRQQLRAEVDAVRAELAAVA